MKTVYIVRFITTSKNYTLNHEYIFEDYDEAEKFRNTLRGAIIYKDTVCETAEKAITELHENEIISK